MCKRNSPHKNKASNGCVRETPKIKKQQLQNNNSMGCVRETSHRKISQPWVVKEKLPPEKQSRHGMCKRNSPHKNEASSGCVRETPRMKMTPAWDV